MCAVMIAHDSGYRRRNSSLMAALDTTQLVPISSVVAPDRGADAARASVATTTTGLHKPC